MNNADSIPGYFCLSKLRYMKKLLILAGIALLGSNAQAQIGIGGQVVYNNYAGYGLSNFGVGVVGNKAADRFDYKLSLNYFITSKIDRTFDLYYDDPMNWTGESYGGTVNGTENYSGFGLWFDMNYFFTGDAEDGGFYGLVGLGLNFMNIGYDIEPYDESKYYTRYDYTKSDKLWQPIIRAGLGYELELDFGNIFVQAQGNLPATSVNGAAIDISLPFSFGGVVGVKVPLD